VNAGRDVDHKALSGLSADERNAILHLACSTVDPKRTLWSNDIAQVNIQDFRDLIGKGSDFSSDVSILHLLPFLSNNFSSHVS